jgi:hypothetical protein
MRASFVTAAATLFAFGSLGSSSLAATTAIGHSKHFHTPSRNIVCWASDGQSRGSQAEGLQCWVSSTGGVGKLPLAWVLTSHGEVSKGRSDGGPGTIGSVLAYRKVGLGATCAATPARPG